MSFLLPVAGAAAGSGASALSIGATLLGGLFTGIAQKNAMEAQAKIAQQNAIMAQQAAERASFKGDIDAQKEGLEKRNLIGAMEAQIGASGISLQGSGTPGRVINSAHQLAMYDQAMKRSDARQAAYNFQVQGYNYQNEAAMKRQSATSNFIGSILGTAASVGNQWARNRTLLS